MNNNQTVIDAIFSYGTCGSTPNPIYDFIRNNGANAALDNNGNTVLHYAALFCQCGLMGYLVNEGADINAKNNEGLTPLHTAVGAGLGFAVEPMLFHGADINEVNNNGETALHIAAKQGENDVALVLLTKGADTTIKDNSGHMALYYAIANRHENIENMIKNVNIKKTIGSFEVGNIEMVF